jgi:hypothetical protein
MRRIDLAKHSGECYLAAFGMDQHPSPSPSHAKVNLANGHGGGSHGVPFPDVLGLRPHLEQGLRRRVECARHNDFTVGWQRECHFTL